MRTPSSFRPAATAQLGRLGPEGSTGRLIPNTIPVLVGDLDGPGLLRDRAPSGAMRFRVVGIEPFSLGIDDDVAGPIRVRVEEIDPACGDHALPAEQQARPGAAAQADAALAPRSMSFRSQEALPFACPAIPGCHRCSLPHG